MILFQITRKIRFIFALIMLSVACRTSEYFDTIDKTPDFIINSMSNSLENELLKVWYPRCVDSVNGGFLADFSYDWTPDGTQEKMIVTQTRHLWSTSRAFLFFDDSLYFRIAQHGFNYIKEKMWDKEFGGFYMFRNTKGEAINDLSGDEKTAYGNAFAIYALSDYYLISYDTSALQLAVETFRWLENHSYDMIHSGYFDNMLRDGSLYSEENSSLKGIELKRKQWKDYNSTIHLLEAFSELYKIWPDSLLHSRTIELIHLLQKTFIDERGFLKLYFEKDWSPVSYRDSARNILVANYYFDHVSFGHDIETAYLMIEASQALGLNNDTLLRIIPKKLVDHALQYGWDRNKGGFYEMGYYFPESKSLTIVSKSKVWWIQAEGLNSLLLMATLFPQEHIYYEYFLHQWNYVEKYLIDHKYGEWYFEGLDQSPQKKRYAKATNWKVSYHNTRALMNCIRMLESKKE
jgi:mannobiose 2-epimerase